MMRFQPDLLSLVYGEGNLAARGSFLILDVSFIVASVERFCPAQNLFLSNTSVTPPQR